LAFLYFHPRRPKFSELQFAGHQPISVSVFSWGANHFMRLVSLCLLNRCFLNFDLGGKGAVQRLTLRCTPDAIKGKNRCLVWDSHKIRKHTVCAEHRICFY